MVILKLQKKVNSLILFDCALVVFFARVQSCMYTKDKCNIKTFPVAYNVVRDCQGYNFLSCVWGSQVKSSPTSTLVILVPSAPIWNDGSKCPRNSPRQSAIADAIADAENICLGKKFANVFFSEFI